MQAEERLKSGDLDEALAELQADVRREPANPEKRVFLFQLLCLLGRWDRALTQLQVLSEMDRKTTPMVQTYGPALKCEALRAEVFAGRRSPLLFGKPQEWMAMLLEALRLTAESKHSEAGALRSRAFEDAPATAGSVVVGGENATEGQPKDGDPQPFAWIADGDARLGPMLEAVVSGRYYWIPFLRLQEIRMEKPTDLRDLVWTPAYLTFANGGQTVALIPTRYPGSEASDDRPIRMARKTTWVERGPETFLGLGQRVLTTDTGEMALLDLRIVKLGGVDDPDRSGTGDTGAPEDEGPDQGSG